MAWGQRFAQLGAAILMCLTGAAFSQQKQEFRYPVGPGASISIVNDNGPVTLKPSSGSQVIVSAAAASKKVEVDASQNGNRVEVRTHSLQAGNPEESRVEYEVLVPPNANVTVRANVGPIRVERVNGDLTLEGDGCTIDVRDASNSVVRARTLTGPITLTNVTNGHVELTSVSGNIAMSNVTGPKVTVNATKSAIRYDGNFAGGGDYSLTNHSGDIDVIMPVDASVDLTERSINGSVQNDYPFQPKAHAGFPITQGRSFAGTANSGASVVRLRSFSGAIRVKKR